jgi:hypothetical protein
MRIPSSTSTTSGPTRSASPGGSSDGMFTSDFIDAAVELGISSLGEGSSMSGRAEDANSVQVGGGGSRHCNGDDDPDHPQSLVQPTRLRSIVRPTANASPSSRAASAARRQQESTTQNTSNVQGSSYNDMEPPSDSSDAQPSSADAQPSSADAQPSSCDTQHSFFDDPFELSILASGVPPSTRNLIFPTIASTPAQTSGSSHDVQPQNTPSTLQLPTILNTASHHPSISSPPFPAVVPTSFKASGLSYDVGPQNTRSARPLPTILNTTSNHPSSPSPPFPAITPTPFGAPVYVGPQNTRSVHQLPTTSTLNPMSQYPSPAQTSWAPRTSSFPPAGSEHFLSPFIPGRERSLSPFISPGYTLHPPRPPSRYGQGFPISPAVHNHLPPSPVHHFMPLPHLAVPQVSSRGFSPPSVPSSSRTSATLMATPAEDHQRESSVTRGLSRGFSPPSVPSSSRTPIMSMATPAEDHQRESSVARGLSGGFSPPSPSSSQTPVIAKTCLNTDHLSSGVPTTRVIPPTPAGNENSKYIENEPRAPFEAPSVASSPSEINLEMREPASPPSSAPNDIGRVSNEHIAIFDGLFDSMDRTISEAVAKTSLSAHKLIEMYAKRHSLKIRPSANTWNNFTRLLKHDDFRRQYIHLVPDGEAEYRAWLPARSEGKAN